MPRAAPFEKSLKKPNVSLFASVIRYKQGPLQDLMSVEFQRQTWPPGQSVGRPLHGEIVVPAAPDRYI